MAKVKKNKRIKITSPGVVFTSRGRCRTPILRPYVENCDIILQMITKNNAKVVEVLDNGVEVPLTILNFASDNSTNKVEERVEEPVKPATVAVEVVNEPVPEVEEPTKHLTRKERRRLEQQQKAESNKQKQEEVVPVVEEPQEEVEETPVVEDAAVPMDSIEE